MKSVLSIASSDPIGATGIQADLKTVAAHQMYGTSAITALTLHNTRGIFSVRDILPGFVDQQIDVVFNDIRPDAVKVGMTSSASIACAVAESLARNHAANVVLDPVMFSAAGSSVIAEGALHALIQLLFPLATVITPNIAEAQALCGFPIATPTDIERAADTIAWLCDDGAALMHMERTDTPAVLIKGGFLSEDGGAADDLLRLPSGECIWLFGGRIDTPNTTGSGSTFSTAIACGLAKGLTIEDAVRDAKDYITGAIESAPGLGHGNGPLDHMWEYHS